MRRLCLLVAADADQTLADGVAEAGFFRACHVESVDAAERALRQWSCDVVLLDRSGVAPANAAIARLRACCTAPIVVRAGEADEDASLRELDAGAAAVLDGRPSSRLVGASLRQLVLAVAAQPAPARQPLRLGSLHLDPDRLAARVSGLPLELSRSQFEALFLLAYRAGSIVSREMLTHALGGYAGPGQRRADTSVYWIRRKLAEAAAVDLVIDTVHGRGYCLSHAESPRQDEPHDLAGGAPGPASRAAPETRRFDAPFELARP